METALMTLQSVVSVICMVLPSPHPGHFHDIHHHTVVSQVITHLHQETHCFVMLVQAEGQPFLSFVTAFVCQEALPLDITPNVLSRKKRRGKMTNYV